MLNRAVGNALSRAAGGGGVMTELMAGARPL
jgi:hypothetical protein